MVLPIFLIGILFSCAYGWMLREQWVALKMGITFSIPYARYLGLDWQDAYLKMIGDLGVRHVRIPVYWSAVEYAPERFDWSELDWLMKVSEQNGVAITLAIGAKVPRWPECFIPEWAQAQDVDARNASLLDFLNQTVARYRSSPALERWQVENEPFFPFGVCPATSSHQVAREISVVRATDPAHRIQTTMSGEWEPWFYATVSSDTLGFSLYRTSWFELFGYLRYPLPPLMYRLHAFAARLFVKEVVISELQAEPWFPDSFRSRPIEDWYQVFGADELRDNIAFAKRTGISEFYLWGAEWWLYMKEQGDDRLWDAAEQEFLKQR